MKKSLLLAVFVCSITNTFSMDESENKHPTGAKWGLLQDKVMNEETHREVSDFKKSLKLPTKSTIKKYTYNQGDLVELSLTKVGQNKFTKESGWPLVNVYDQGELGSCTANAVALTIRLSSILNSKNPTQVLNNPEMRDVSRLYGYYNTRFYEGSLSNYSKNVLEDNGATIYGSVMSGKLFGFIAEQQQKEVSISTDKDLSGRLSYYYWPYNTKTFASAPSTLAYVEGMNPNYMNSAYSSLISSYRFKELDDQFKTGTSTSTTQMQQFRDVIVGELAQNRPVDFGISLDQNNFNFDKNGFFVIPRNIDISTYMNKYFIPNAGHAMVITGYGPYKKLFGIDPRDNSNYYKAYTSWGNFGDPKSPGAIYFPEGYINNIAKAGTEALSIWLEKPQPIQQAKQSPQIPSNATLSQKVNSVFSDPNYFSEVESTTLKNFWATSESNYTASQSHLDNIQGYLNAGQGIFGTNVAKKIFDINSLKTGQSIVNTWNK